MSRLLIYRPKRLDFKHYISSDIHKWHRKYKSYTEEKMVNFGRIDLLEVFYLMRYKSLDLCFYRTIACNGRVDLINPYLLDLTLLKFTESKKYEFIHIIQSEILELTIFNNIEQIDIIYRLKHLLLDKYVTDGIINELFNAFPPDFEDNDRILVGIYNIGGISVKRVIYDGYKTTLTEK